MHIAASPLRFPDEHPVDGAAGLQPLPCIPKTVSSARQDSAVLMLPTGTEAFILGVLLVNSLHFTFFTILHILLWSEFYVTSACAIYVCSCANSFSTP